MRGGVVNATTSRRTREMTMAAAKATATVMATGNALTLPLRDLATTITTTTANDHAAGDAGVGAGGSWHHE
jgi:hypothetical protein